MTPQRVTIAVLVACIMAGSIADLLFVRWARNGSLVLLGMGTVIYAIDAACWGVSLRYGVSIRTVAVLYGVATALAGVLIGAWVGEPFPPRYIVGTVLGIIATGLLLS